MGDVGDDYRAMTKDKKDRHSAWCEHNIEILSVRMAGRYIQHETVCLFREQGKPKVDFYPHTGRWKSGTKMYRGGANAFCAWYDKQ